MHWAGCGTGLNINKYNSLDDDIKYYRNSTTIRSEYYTYYTQHTQNTHNISTQGKDTKKYTIFFFFLYVCNILFSY